MPQFIKTKSDLKEFLDYESAVKKFRVFRF